MLVDVATFRLLFLEFAEVEDLAVETALDVASCVFRENGCEAATLYLAAHLLTIDVSLGVGGKGASVDGGSKNLSSVSVGKISKVYSAATSDDANDNDLDTTAYGRRYKLLRDGCKSRKLVAYNL